MLFVFHGGTVMLPRIIVSLANVIGICSIIEANGLIY
jgi:hypothetical protein